MKIYESIYYWAALATLLVMVLKSSGVIVDVEYSNKESIILFTMFIGFAQLDCILYMVRELYDKHSGGFK